MDMGMDDSIEVGDPGMGDATGDTGQGVTLTITIQGDTITCNGEPCDIGEAMRKVLDAYESQESPDGDEANFQAGLGNRASNPKPGDPAAGGGMTGKNGGGY
jgi:hypothetical protein